MASKESGPGLLDKCEEDIKQLLEEAVPANTGRATDMWIKVISSFCTDKDIVLDLATCSAVELKTVCNVSFICP